MKEVFVSKKVETAVAGQMSHRQILLVLVGLMAGMFLSALDQSVVGTAMIRDQYKGRDMARIMSLVPAEAKSLARDDRLARESGERIAKTKADAERKRQEAQLKAAFIYRFAQYTDWPPPPLRGRGCGGPARRARAPGLAGR